jgi:hypothetical protein
MDAACCGWVFGIGTYLKLFDGEASTKEDLCGGASEAAYEGLLFLFGC